MTYLEKILEEKTIDRSKLAEKLNINYNTLTNWIKNKSITKHIDFIKLIKFLEIDQEDFIKNHNKKY